MYAAACMWWLLTAVTAAPVGLTPLGVLLMCFVCLARPWCCPVLCWMQTAVQQALLCLPWIACMYCLCCAVHVSDVTKLSWVGQAGSAIFAMACQRQG